MLTGFSNLGLATQELTPQALTQPNRLQRAVDAVIRILKGPATVLAIFAALWAMARACHYGQLYLEPFVDTAPTGAMSGILRAIISVMGPIRHYSEKVRDWLAPTAAAAWSQLALFVKTSWTTFTTWADSL